METQVLLPKNRAAAWDQIANGELAFDFFADAPSATGPVLDWHAQEKVGVKEAIIRWLEEQI
jgi:hypothetical protein